MEHLFPIFQYEIRYNVILDFSNYNRTLLAPFVKLANGLGVDKQKSTGEEVLTLHFEDDFYNISIYWDRVVFKSEGDISKFRNSNSVIDEPFFNIFDKIKELVSFGSTVNHLIHFIAIYPMDKENSEILQTFKENYFKSKAFNDYGNFNDTCIISEFKDKNQEIKLEHGPYLGIEDLEKRKIIPVKNSVEYSKAGEVKGEMLVCTKFEKTNNVNFGSFKNLLIESLKPLDKIWKQ